MEILTGVSAGERTPLGAFPPGSVNRAVVERLDQYSTIRQSFGMVPGSVRGAPGARGRRR
jgi:hypothetical protein